jgi:hypothetical protein
VHLDETKERAKGRRQRVTVEEEKNKLKGRGKKGRAREMIVGRRKRMREEEGQKKGTGNTLQSQGEYNASWKRRESNGRLADVG